MQHERTFVSQQVRGLFQREIAMGVCRYALSCCSPLLLAGRRLDPVTGYRRRLLAAAQAQEMPYDCQPIKAKAPGELGYHALLPTQLPVVLQAVWGAGCLVAERARSVNW